MRRFTAVSLAALAIAFAAPAAFAQGPIWIVDGELIDGDAQAPAEEGAEQGAERHRYDDHSAIQNWCCPKNVVGVIVGQHR